MDNSAETRRGARRVRIQTGFGSAGAGSRAARRKATSAGVGQTYAVEGLRLIARARQGHLNEVDRHTIEEAVREQLCCFCDDPRTFKNVGTHWRLAHGLAFNDLRDAMLWPRRTPLASTEVRQARSKQSRALWTPEQGAKMQAGQKGAKKSIGTYGRRAQSAKGHFGGIATRHWKVCQICGDDYYGAKQYKTCRKPECTSALRSRQSQRPAPWNANRPPRPSRMVPCSVCGKNLVVAWRRKTCSDECRSRALAEAVSRPERQAAWREGAARRVERLKATRPQACIVDDCEGRPVGRGLCERHYRQQPDQREKQRQQYRRRRDRRAVTPE